MEILSDLPQTQVSLSAEIREKGTKLRLDRWEA